MPILTVTTYITLRYTLQSNLGIHRCLVAPTKCSFGFGLGLGLGLGLERSGLGLGLGLEGSGLVDLDLDFLVSAGLGLGLGLEGSGLGLGLGYWWTCYKSEYSCHTQSPRRWWQVGC